MVLQSSSMIMQLSVLFANDDPTRPVKTVTDKAYGRTLHFHPFHTDAELRMMNPHLCAVTEALDKSNKKARLGVEGSFMNQVTKFKLVDCFKKHIRFFKTGVPGGPSCAVYGTCRLLCLTYLHALKIVLVLSQELLEFLRLLLQNTCIP